MTDYEIMTYAEQVLGFQPEWYDDGESILGVAMWIAPDGVWHVFSTLKEEVVKHLAESTPHQEAIKAALSTR